jgi:CBS domain containing-hemolysin-like protein
MSETIGGVLGPLLIIALLIVANGLFVAAEFAIVGAPRASIERLAVAGNRAARLVGRILDDRREVDRFIATAQLGITLASLGLGMYGEHLLADWFAELFGPLGVGRWIAAHTLGSIVAVAVLTYFHIVIGEMVPKSIALQRADRSILWIAPVMRVVQWIFAPLVFALNGIGNGALRVLRIDRHADTGETVRTADELAYIVRESQAGGLLRTESASVVQELLEFGDLTAEQVMVPRVRVIGLDRTDRWADVIAVLDHAPHSRYPVMDGDLDHIVGYVHVKDMLGEPAPDLTVGALPLRPVPFVPGAASTEAVLAAMRAQRSQLVVVMDEFGGTSGIITLEDLLEEVIGDVSDDTEARGEIERLPDGRLLVAGAARVVDVGAALGASVEHPDVETVSGLVLALKGRPPVPGDRVEYEELRIDVVEVRGRGVHAAHVERRALP